MARNTSVIGIYPDRTTVSDAVNVLHKAGYRTTDISVLSSDNQGSKDFALVKRAKALEGAAAGAAVCAVVGAALAWFCSIQTEMCIRDRVITVLLFHSSAFAPGENTTPASARQNTVDTAVFKTLICFFSFDLDTCAAGPSLCRAPCLQDSAGWQHTMDKKHSKVHRHITMRRARLLCRSGPCLPYLEGNGAQRQS